MITKYISFNAVRISKWTSVLQNFSLWNINLVLALCNSLNERYFTLIKSYKIHICLSWVFDLLLGPQRLKITQKSQNNLVFKYWFCKKQKCFWAMKWTGHFCVKYAIFVHFLKFPMYHPNPGARAPKLQAFFYINSHAYQISRKSG